MQSDQLSLTIINKEITRNKQTSKQMEVSKNSRKIVDKPRSINLTLVSQALTIVLERLMLPWIKLDEVTLNTRRVEILHNELIPSVFFISSKQNQSKMKIYASLKNESECSFHGDRLFDSLQNLDIVSKYGTLISVSQTFHLNKNFYFPYKLCYCTDERSLTDERL